MRPTFVWTSTMLSAGLGSVACGSPSSVTSSTDSGAAVEASADAGHSNDAEGAGVGDAGVGDHADGSTGIGLLDCAWTAGNNCWKATVARAAGCLPPPSAQGTISVDGTTCTYPDGTTLTFEPALMTSVPGFGNFSSFAVTVGNTTCLSFANNDAGTGSATTTQAGTVVLAAAQGGEDEMVTCPDGTMYSGAVATLNTCPSGFPSLGEGYGGVLTFWLNDTGIDGGTIVFRCGL